MTVIGPVLAPKPESALLEVLVHVDNRGRGWWFNVVHVANVRQETTLATVHCATKVFLHLSWLRGIVEVAAKGRTRAGVCLKCTQFVCGFLDTTDPNGQLMADRDAASAAQKRDE